MKINKHLKLNRSERSHEYNEAGKIARKKIVKLIKQENIHFKQTYKASKSNNAYYQQKFDYVDNLMKKTIIMPKQSDYTPMQQTIVIAHELGHYMVYKKSSPKIMRYLIKGGKYITYLNEYLAWKQAKKILKKMKVWKIKNVEGEYKNIMYSSLNTYKPSERFSMFVMKRLLKTIYIAIKYWIVAYFVTGLLYLFEQSNIPVPYNILGIELFTDVNEFKFYVIVFSIYIISILLKLITIKNKRKDR